MAKSNPSKRLLLAKYIAEKNPALVAEPEWREIRDRLTPVSDGYLRRLLRDSGLPLAPLVEGVRQDSFESLEHSLLRLAEVYAEARDKADAATADRCRRIVIEAKDHARLAARSPKASPIKQAEKQAMIEWMLIWLENPGVFPAWARLRKRQPAD